MNQAVPANVYTDCTEGDAGVIIASKYAISPKMIQDILNMAKAHNYTPYRHIMVVKRPNNTFTVIESANEF
jgi:hypothetical protein